MTNKEEFDWASTADLDIEHLLMSFNRHPEIKERLQSAEIILVPSNVRLQYAGRNLLYSHREVLEGPFQEFSGFVFPDSTEIFYGLLCEEFGEHAKIEIAANEDDYVELSFKSIEINLPTLYICNASLLPLLLPVLAVIINRLQKRKRNQDVEVQVKLNLLVDFKNRLCRVQYDSRRKTFSRPTPLEMEDFAPTLQEDESEETQNNDH